MILSASLGGIILTIEEIASTVIDRLRGKVIIHRYDSHSTNSIYLKFDYGLANSLRISDHPGKKYLKYRYNILTTQTCKQNKVDHGFERIYYGPTMIKAVCRDVLQQKQERKRRYKDYDGLVMQKPSQIQHEKGFWEQAKEVR